MISKFLYTEFVERAEEHWIFPSSEPIQERLKTFIMQDMQLTLLLCTTNVLLGLW